MAILGEPDAELEDMLGEIEMIQRAAMKPIKAGAPASVIYGVGDPLVAKSKHAEHVYFLATAWAWSATRRRGSSQDGL